MRNGTEKNKDIQTALLADDKEPGCCASIFSLFSSNTDTSSEKRETMSDEQLIRIAGMM